MLEGRNHIPVARLGCITPTLLGLSDTDHSLPIMRRGAGTRG